MNNTNDIDIIKQCILNNRLSYQYIPYEYKYDIDIIKLSINQNGLVYQYIKKIYKSNIEISNQLKNIIYNN